jgi:Cys-tRNA(Pro) deacylase
MKTSVDVHNHLQSLDIKHELVALSGSIKNATRLADLLGLELASIIKALVFTADGAPLLAIVPGDRRADPKKIKKVSGAKKISFATDDEVMNMTGYSVGATPPVAWKSQPAAFIDPTVRKTDIVYAAGGETNIVLKMRSSDLVAATGATVADIAE